MGDDLQRALEWLAARFKDGEKRLAKNPVTFIYDVATEVRRLQGQHCCTLFPDTEAPPGIERWKCRVCDGRLVPVEHVEKLRTALAAWVKWEANPDGEYPTRDLYWRMRKAQDLAEQSRELLEGKK